MTKAVTQPEANHGGMIIYCAKISREYRHGDGISQRLGELKDLTGDDWCHMIDGAGRLMIQRKSRADHLGWGWQDAK